MRVASKVNLVKTGMHTSIDRVLFHCPRDLEGREKALRTEHLLLEITVVLAEGFLRSGKYMLVFRRTIVQVAIH